MNQARVGLLAAVALVMWPLAAEAQPAKPGAAKPGDDKAAEAKPGEDGAAKPDDVKPGEDTPDPGGDTGDGEGTEVAGEGEGTPEGEGLGDICKIDPKACPSIDLEKAAARPLNPEMYSVQQIYALKKLRFEINPYFGIGLNDQFVTHPNLGMALNFYITNSIAVGVNGGYFFNSPSEFNYQTSRAARVGEPITEYQWNANGNFTYVPAYGKFAGFSDFIFHYDFFLVGGVGAISTRPIAVVDPDNRSFDYKVKISFNAGLGLRIFFNRWFAVTGEIRDYIFFDELENPAIARGLGANGLPAAQNPDTWLSEDLSFTNNVQAQIGVSFFLPPTWEYKLPK